LPSGLDVDIFSFHLPALLAKTSVQALEVDVVGVIAYHIFLQLHRDCSVTQHVDVHVMLACDVGRGVP